MPKSFDDVKTVFPFGKHKGKTLEEVPDSYMNWAIGNCNFLDDLFKSLLKCEMNRRAKEGIIVVDEDIPDYRGDDAYWIGM